MSPTDIQRFNGGAVEHGTTTSNAAGSEIERSAEAGTSALEAQAKALIQARLFLAKQVSRSWDNVEQKLRRECARPGFANSAWWILPYGNDPQKYPKGLSIRFAEAALRLAGNIDIQQQTVYDDSWKRIVRVTVLDLEGNYSITSEVTVDKTVERSSATGRQVLSVRQNSSGKMTYLVAGTEQEVALKQGSAVSKAIRTNGLRLIPGDILDECKAIIEETRKKGAAAEDPETARKAILDHFAELGVMPADLAKFLEHDTNIFQPAEREQLRGIYQAIRDGNATWRDVLEAKFGPQEGSEETEAAKKLKEKLHSRKPTESTTKPGSGDTPQASATHVTPGATAPTTNQEQPKGGPPTEDTGGTAARAGDQTAQPSKKGMIFFEGTEWPQDAPQDRPFKWNGVTYQFDEGAGNFRKVEESAADNLFAGQTPPAGPVRDPGEDRKGKRR